MRRSVFSAIFVVSFAAILLEIAYTRIFSFKVYYYFTYLIIGLALLGLGAGGVLVAISERLRALELARLVPACCSGAGALVLLGYLVISPLPLNVSDLFVAPLEPVKLLAASLLLFAPFLAVGVVVSAILSARPERVSELYGVDLLGAGLACTASIPLLEWLTPPGCVVLAGLGLVLAGVPAAVTAGSRLQRTAAGVASATLLAAVFAADALPDPVTDRLKHLEGWRRAGAVRYSAWTPIFRVDVSDHPDGTSYVIHHDGQLGSALHPFDGDFSGLEGFRQDARSTPFAVAPEAPGVLIVGAAGGHEVLVSLFFGASHVTGVELNPATHVVLTDVYADYAGRLHEDSRVDLVVAEGRSFLRRSDQRFDLIWLVAPDSYAAMNASTSAAYVLSESYLYTTEMIRESLAHLTPEGVVCAQFGELDYARKPNRTARFVSTARQALADAGVRDPSRHLLVATSSDIPPFVLSTVLVGRSPFSETVIDRFLAQTAAVRGGAVRFAPGRALEDGPVGRIASMPADALRAFYRAQPFDLTPVTDDAPFFWHFSRFRDVVAAPVARALVLDWEDAIGERVLLVLLALVVLLGGAFLLLPFAAIRPVWREIPHRGAAFAYFAALGLGFMLLEVSLIQMLTLFLGYPTRSLSVTLFGLLVFAGAGSLLSTSYLKRRNLALVILLGALAILVLACRAGLPLLVDALIGAPLAVRVAACVGVIAPLGLCLGAFMPLGLRSVAAGTPHVREVVAWSWAVNGFFSVLSSILGVILAMTLGFRAVLLIALGLYVVGVLAVLRIPAPEGARR